MRMPRQIGAHPTALPEGEAGCENRMGSRWRPVVPQNSGGNQASMSSQIPNGFFTTFRLIIENRMVFVLTTFITPFSFALGARRKFFAFSRFENAIHGPSVGEAPAQHKSHCPTSSRDVALGTTGTPEPRVFLRWLRFEGISYGARC